VHMFIRRDQMRASQIMQQRIRESSNIKIYWNTVVEEILGEIRVEGVRIKNTSTGINETIPVNGFFVAIGHEPNSAIFREWLDLDDTGYIKTIPGSSRTNMEGIFAAGDVQDRIYRQAVTAAGSGCMAALDAERWLSLQPKITV
jgi:thioredoxin reductase (NADPH)